MDSYTPSESSSSSDDDEEGEDALDILASSDGAIRTLVGGMEDVSSSGDVDIHFADSDDDAAGGGTRWVESTATLQPLNSLPRSNLLNVNNLRCVLRVGRGGGGSL